MVHKQSKRKKICTSNKDESPEQIVDDDLMGRVKLDCMLDIIQTREKGKIGKANAVKMELKMNRSIRKILDRDVPFYELTLPEKVKNESKQLPRPNFRLTPLGQ